MPVLNWIGKDKVVNHDKELPFRVLKPIKEFSVGENSENLLIEGDNLEALKALMPFYYGKIKCIYIDPPYNTGNEKWVYNDRVNSPQIRGWLNKVVGAEGEDLCRHDKWLCMMYPRLKLLKDLMSDDGAIFISIDDNEVHNLRQLLDELFGEQNFISSISWEKADSPRMDAQYFSSRHDYVLVYAKDKTRFKINKINFNEDEMPSHYDKVDDSGRAYYLKPLRAMGGQGETRASRPRLFYPLVAPDGTQILPKLQNGTDGAWRWSQEKVEDEKERIEWKKGSNGWTPYFRIYADSSQGRPPETILFHYQVGSSRTAKAQIKKLLPEGITFDTPKPVELLKFIVKISTGSNDIILDSFAGSGTTGHAVSELNKEDESSRKFILVELEEKIAKEVTAKRLKKIGQDFKYLDLNGELYGTSGFINSNAQYEDLAAYIFFTETHNYLDIHSIKNSYIGAQGSMNYFLFFEGKGNNILDEKTLKKTDGYKGKKVIYADKCLIDSERLDELGITFKQIPYELKKY